MLKKKMFRDIKNNLSQFITIFLMVAIGVMAYFGIEAYMSGMQETADKFYTENNLQDLNVVGINFTESDLKKIKSIDNVKDAERKLSITGSSNNDKTLLLNFIEENNIANSINKIKKRNVQEYSQFMSQFDFSYFNNLYKITNFSKLMADYIRKNIVNFSDLSEEELRILKEIDEENLSDNN